MVLGDADLWSVQSGRLLWPTFWLCFFAAALLIASYVFCSLYSGNAKIGFLGALIVWFFATVGLAVRGQVIGYVLLVLELLLLYLGKLAIRDGFLPCRSS